MTLAEKIDESQTQATRHVRAALGLHPQLVAERASELPLWEAHLGETRYVGEVGLDAGPRFFKSFSSAIRTRVNMSTHVASLLSAQTMKRRASSRIRKRSDPRAAEPHRR